MSSQHFTYLNGRFLPAETAALPLDDIGFLWGATATERLRTFNGKLFRLDDHLRRFRHSCDAAMIPQPRNDAELTAIANELLDKNRTALSEVSEFSISLFATPGRVSEPTLGLQATPLAFETYAPLFREGARLQVVELSGGCSLGVHTAIKHRSRLPWWIATQRVSAGHSPLFASETPDCFVRETPIANFIAVIDGKIVSPPRASILNGVSLCVVEELCSALKIPFTERELPLAEIFSFATECLLTSTNFCLAPVYAIVENSPGAKAWFRPAESSSPMFNRLLQAWNEMVGLDIDEQFLHRRLRQSLP